MKESNPVKWESLWVPVGLLVDEPSSVKVPLGEIVCVTESVGVTLKDAVRDADR